MVAILGTFRVSNIRKSDTLDVVNFKAGAPIGRKNAEGKSEYINIDCAIWGAQGTKVFLPYVKEGNYVTLNLQLEGLSIWEANGKSGVNVKAKVLDLTLISNAAVPDTDGASADDLATATTQAANPTVAPAAKENIPPF